jgi:hypothetical protein
LGQIQPASNQPSCSDAFLIPCWSGEAFVASPRPLTGADIRMLMDRMLWARSAKWRSRRPIPWLSDNGPQ